MTYIRAGLCALGASVLSLVIILFILTAPTVASAQVATTSTATTTPTLNPYDSVDVEAAVRLYFADIPVMAAIAKCESSFTQYNSNGKVLNGGSGGMIGVFQVNKSVHAKFALTLGDDITTLAGNMAYARYLYNQEGTDPWISSEGCWGGVVSAGLLPAVASSTLAAIKSIVTPTTAHAATLTPSPSHELDQSVGTTKKLTQNLKVGSVSTQVATLQQLLNTAGYKIAKTGAGSPGQESTTFGTATKLAVERFQCAQGIACKGTEGTTGYGYVGVKTRAALMLNS